ncbi:hypothetical protein CDV57_01306 [Aspergillus fumigatus]|nr:hypothetical protein CDV57_01306 [Aspergillus fumigatus]
MWIGLVAGTTGALSLKGVEQLSRMLCKAMMYQGIAPCCVMSVEIACEDKLPLLYYSQLTLLDASLDIIQDQLSAGGAYGFVKRYLLGYTHFLGTTPEASEPHPTSIANCPGNRTSHQTLSSV